MTRMESRHFDHCRRIQLAICKKSLFDLRLPLGACLGINELQLRHLRFLFVVYLIQCFVIQPWRHRRQHYII